MDRYDLVRADNLSVAIEALYNKNSTFANLKGADRASDQLTQDYFVLCEELKKACDKGNKSEVRRICNEILEMFDAFENNIKMLRNEESFVKNAKMKSTLQALMGVLTTIMGLGLTASGITVAKNNIGCGDVAIGSTAAAVGTLNAGIGVLGTIENIKALRKKSTISIENTLGMIRQCRVQVKDVMKNYG